MVVYPLSPTPGLWGTLTPLFCGHLRPDYLPQDLAAPDWETRLLSRFLVEVDTGSGWEPVPVRKLSADPQAPLPAWAGEALAHVQRIRILVPQVERQSIDAPGSAAPAS